MIEPTTRTNDNSVNKPMGLFSHADPAIATNISLHSLNLMQTGDGIDSVYGGSTAMPFSVADLVDHPMSLYRTPASMQIG